MAKLAQGSELYFIDPDTSEVVQVKGITGFNPGGAPADPIETTPLEVLEREYILGLRTPGQATITINADPNEASHVRLYELYESDEKPKLQWVLGWSDGKGIAPTIATGGDTFELPNTRTWFQIEGYVSDFPFDFQSNAVVSSTVTVQRSGGAKWSRKGAV